MESARKWEDVEQMRHWSLKQLRQRYRQEFGEETRSSHREFLFRKLAWRLQCAAEGDLSERARRRAEEIANDNDLRLTAPRVRNRRPEKAVSRKAGLRAGAELRREFRGRTIVVEVLEEGFRYDGRPF